MLKNKFNYKYNKSQYMFKCKALDPKTNKCTKHGTKPRVCSGYPLYGLLTLPSDYKLFTPDCGFKE